MIMKLTDKESNRLQKEIDHILDSDVNSIRLLEMIDRFLERRDVVNKNDLLPRVSNSALIDYIENDAEIAMPIDEFFNEDGSNITKKQYGKVLLKYIVKELREHYC